MTEKKFKDGNSRSNSPRKSLSPVKSMKVGIKITFDKKELISPSSLKPKSKGILKTDKTDENLPQTASSTQNTVLSKKSKVNNDKTKAEKDMAQSSRAKEGKDIAVNKKSKKRIQFSDTTKTEGSDAQTAKAKIAGTEIGEATEPSRKKLKNENDLKTLEPERKR